MLSPIDKFNTSAPTSRNVKLNQTQFGGISLMKNEEKSKSKIETYAV